MARLSLFALLISVCLLACGVRVSHTYTRASPMPLDVRAPDQVELLTVVPSQRHYIEIGFIVVEDETRYANHDRQRLLHHVRTRAGQMGCHAVVFQRADRVVDADGIFTKSAAALSGYQAACLVYPDAASTRRGTGADPDPSDPCALHRGRIRSAIPGAAQRDAVMAAPAPCR